MQRKNAGDALPCPKRTVYQNRHHWPPAAGSQTFIDSYTAACTSINKVQAALVMRSLSIQLHDFSIFRNVHAAFNALTAYKFMRIGAADGGMIHGIHVYGDDFGLL